VKKIFICMSFIIFIATFSSFAAKNKNLYPGEKLINVDGFQAVVKFKKGIDTKPLVVLIPGFAHMARIFYGSPECNQKDFLEYWIHKEGYSFLGISYPIQNPAFTKVYPNYNITDWGKQTADITSQYIKKYDLSKNVILVGWSMAGRIAPTFNIAAEKDKINLNLFIGLSSAPALPQCNPGNIIKEYKMAPNGLIRTHMFNNLFYKCILAQNKLNGHQIIPKHIYMNQFMGNLPVELFGSPTRYNNGIWINNFAEALKDSHAENISDYPVTGIIYNSGIYTSPVTGQLAILNKSYWSQIIDQKIYHLFMKNKKIGKLRPDKTDQIARITSSATKNLSLSIYGSHFFFVGKKGAEKTAQDITELYKKVIKYNREVKTV